MKVTSGHISPVLRAIELCEQNLREEFSIEEMAKAAGYSLFHFCRVFSGVTGMPPYQYLMRRRLSEAARDLVESERNIGTIAFDYWFGSPEGFARAFRRYFGVLPSECRNGLILDRSILMPVVDEALLRHRQERRLPEHRFPDLPDRIYGLMIAAEDVFFDPTPLRKRIAGLTGQPLPPWGMRLYPADHDTCGWFSCWGYACPFPGLAAFEPPSLPALKGAHAGGPYQTPFTVTCLRHLRSHTVPLTPVRIVLEHVRKTETGIQTLVATG